MSSLNKAQIIGNLGKDPEIRTMNNGSKLASFSVATTERWKDKASGERKEATEWHRVTVFNPNLVEIVQKYVSKGSKVYIEGQIKTRKWIDKDGNDRYTTEIVLNPYNGQIVLLGDSNGRRSQEMDSAPTTVGTPPSGSARLYDDDIPF